MIKRLTRFLSLAIAATALMPLSALGRDLSGKVTDSETGEPVAAVFVKTLSAENLALATTQTDADGIFSIPVAEEARSLYVGTPGYIDRILPLDSLLNAAEVVIPLRPYHSVDLDEVTVTASTVSTKGNVETYTITDRMRQNTVNAIGLLGKLPGFSVNPITEEVKAGYLTGIKIVVDDEEVSESYYKSINPKRIQKIELIRNSSGKYSQYPAVLNIVLKKDYEGLDVNVNSRTSVVPVTKPDWTQQLSSGITMSYRRWYYFVNAMYWHAASGSVRGRDLEFPGRLTITTPMPGLSEPNERKVRNIWQGNAGVGVKLTQRQSLTGQFLYERSGSRTRDSSVTIIDRLRESSDIRGKYDSDNYVAGLTYSNRVSDRLSLYASATYNAYSIGENRRSVFSHDAAEAASQSLHSDKDYLSAFTNEWIDLNDNWSMNVSYMYTWRRYRTLNDAGVRGRYTENRHMPVVQGNFQYGSFSGNIGLSYLDIASRNDDSSVHNRSLLPKVNLHWQANKRLALSLNYYSATDYPVLDQLSTQTWTVADRVMQTGNPELKATTTNYLQASVKLLQCLNLTYMFRHTDNDVSTIYSLQEGTAGPYLLGSLVNVSNSHQYAGIQFSKSLHDQLEVFVNCTYQWYTNAYRGTKGHGRTWYGDFSATWDVMGSGYRLYANLFLRDDRRPIPQGFETNNQENLMISCSKLFLGNRLQISAGFNIPTHLISHLDTRSVQTPEFRYSQSEDFSRMFHWVTRLNITYVFDKGKRTERPGQIEYEREK